ncbi:MAG: zinc-binding dehydrogenase [Bacteroidetes bacterium]|nr:zinc-binding dehydrogenase [Bacteroidota bacterium]
MKIRCLRIPDYALNIVRAAKSMWLETLDQEVGLKPDQVLIHLLAAPINPSDISFIQGRYNIRKSLPAIPGFEAAGIVVLTGNDPKAKALDGKRVSCFTQEKEWGTWSEYFVAGCGDCIPIEDGIPDDQAACLSVNPLTAFGLFRHVKDKGCPSVLLNAAGSQVASLIRQMASMEGINVINIVRKSEQADYLLQQGEQYVINQQEEGFQDILEKMTHKLDTRLALDAVGGELSGIILNSMPGNSELVIYGGLSGKPTGSFDNLEMIFQGKAFRGWNLYDWKKEVGEEGFQKATAKIQKWILEGKLKTTIQATLPIDQFESGLFQYIKNMSGGKILFTP